MITSDEVSIRQAALREAMHDADLDAVLVTEKYNYWFLTGHQSREFDKIMRPMLFLLTRSGPACAIVYAQQLPKVEKLTPDVIGYGYEDIPLDIGLLQQALEEQGVANGRLGMELGTNQRLGLSYLDLQTLLRNCPELTIVDAGPVLEDVKIRKSDYEVACLRQASTMSLQAWDATVEQISLGMTEREIRRLLATELTRHGSDFDVAGHVATATNRNDDNVPLEVGDTLWADFGATYAGYQADLARRAVFGQPRSDHRETEERIASLLAASLSAVRAGNRASDVARACNAQLKALDLPGLGAKKRIGHGLGLIAGEAPSLSLGDDTILQAGMVLCVEPRFFLPTGEKIHVEDIVVVTEDGYDPITEGAGTLRVIDV